MAELTFNSPIRRDKWPRWMIKLHEYLKKIYEIPVEEVEPDDYDRLKRIIFEKLVALRKDKLMMKDIRSVFTSFLCFFFLAIPVIVAGNLYLYQ